MARTNVVAHNLQGMITNRQLGITNKIKAKSTEKLSSGYRINRSADDAAGLAISEKMRKQIRGLTQGTANSQDGVSMCQVADGALTEVQDMLHRITELSVKSANGTNAYDDRQAIQKEINQILAEIDRVCDTTKFNEQTIFQGTQGVSIIPAVFEPSTVGEFAASGTPEGTNAGIYTITADNAGFSIDSESHEWSDFTDGAGHTLADPEITGGTFSFTHKGITMSLEVQTGASMEDVIGKLNGAGYSTKIDSSTQTKLSSLINISYNASAHAGDSEVYGVGYAVNRTPQIKVEGSSVKLYTGLVGNDGKEITASGTISLGSTFTLSESVPPYGIVFGGDSIASAISIDKNEDFHDPEYGYFENYTGNIIGDLHVTPNPENEKIINRDITELPGQDIINFVNGMTISSAGYEDTTRGGIIIRRFRPSVGMDNLSFSHDGLHDKSYDTDVTLKLDRVFSPDYMGKQVTPEERISSLEDKTVWIQSGADAGDGIMLSIGRMDTNMLGIHGLDVSTDNNATESIDKVGNALSKISSIRSAIGAQQNRLEHTIKNQNNIVENTQSAESLIRDTDMAKEMVKYSNQSILQQAGQTMLAQTSKANQTVLSLLQ